MNAKTEFARSMNAKAEHQNMNAKTERQKTWTPKLSLGVGTKAEFVSGRGKPWVRQWIAH